MKAEPAATAESGPTSRYYSCDGVRLHYLDWGGDRSSRTFILLHGGSAHAHWWDGVAPILSAHGRVAALDFRGHGRSEWTRPPRYGPAGYLADLRGLIEHLGGRAVVVGHSMGGAVALWAAVTYPELLDAIVIVDAPNGPPPLFRRLMWRWRRKAQGGKRPELPSADAVKRKFRLSPAGTYLTREQLARLAMLGAERLDNGNWAFRVDPETRAWRKSGGRMRKVKLGLIEIPALILRGAESTLVGAWTARRMHRRIRGSHYREIPRAYHHVPLDNPTDTAREIVEFVQSL
jgi:pimeloyl-ACP methyl ester carboxylesterase